MKRKILFFITLLAIVSMATMQSCKEDEIVQPTEKASFTDPVVSAPSDGSLISVTGTTVDLVWESTNAEGFAPSWDVYFGEESDPELYATGHTTNSITVPVEVAKEYHWRVEIADANGIITSSPEWSFEVIDPAAHITMDLTWETNVLDVVGIDLDPRDVANVRLRILKSDLTAAVPAINTTGFETFGNFHTLADGKYFIAVDLTATIDAGDFNAPVDLDLQLDFSQRGIQEESYSFPAVMTNEFVCSTYRVYLGYVTKTGSEYVFTKEVTKPVSALSHVWYGLDNAGFEYTSQVETFQGCSLQIKGLSYEWMSDYWGEVIIKGGTASITIDVTTGVVTIPNQFYCRTKWNGAVQPDYMIEGTGTYNATGAFPTMTITYDLIQNGTSMADQDALSRPAFVATLTLDPAQAKRLGNKLHFTTPAVKPAR